MSTIDPGTEQSSREIGTTAKLVEKYSKWEFNSEVMVGGNFPIYFVMRFCRSVRFPIDEPAGGIFRRRN